MRFNLLSIVVSTTLFALAKSQGVQNAENPFTAPVGDVTLVAGQSYNIAWKPDTPGTISLALMKGPAANLIFVKTIADHIPNTGNFPWTPDVDLEGLQTMAAGDGYGFKIINDATQNFDWSGHWQLQNAASTFNSAAGTSSSVANSAPATSSVASSTSEPASTQTSSVAPTSTSSALTTGSSSVAPATVASTTSSSTSSVVPATTSSTSSTEPVSQTTSVSTTLATTTSSVDPSTTSVSSTETSSTSPTSGTSSLSTASNSPTHSSSSETTPSSSSSATAAVPSSGKLTTYAIAGISVGAIAIVAGLLVGFFILRRRAQTKRESVMFGTKTPGAYDAEFAMMERRQRESGGFLNSGYNRMSSGRDFREIGQASSTF